MKPTIQRFTLVIIILTLFYSSDLIGQKRNYTSTSLEMIFSWADVADDAASVNSIMRWAPVLNIQFLYNMDISDKFGFFTGVDLRNLGYIVKYPKSKKFKFRTYNLGIPVGIKLGNIRTGFFVYLGGQVEFAFNFKQKEFLDNSKQNKDVYWFTSRVNVVQPSAFLGFNFPYGVNLKFKYYFIDLLNRDYQTYDNSGNLVRPYASISNSKIFYFSLSFNMFHPDYEYFRSEITGEEMRHNK